jgi:carbonic anhydrase/acetyltransferase-like protein (isoleucine patch superfamily)
MPIYALGGFEPTIHPTAFVHPEAVVIGKVTIGEQSSVWPCAVLRGDGAGIVVGARTSVQDGSVLHCTDELQTVVGDDCVLGHLVHLECCTVEDNALVGNGSIVLHNAIIRSWSLVGSNAVVPDNMEVPTGTMALGVPAKLRDKAPSREMISDIAAGYVARAARYRDELRRID